MLVEKVETGSTNDDAKALALAGAPQGTGVLAQRQTAGRGRAGRPFASPGGGLYLSLVLRPACPPHRWSLLPLVAGLGVADCLEAFGYPAQLKWPNDLLLGGGKVGGILVESVWGERPFAVVGLGLNLLARPAGVDGTACLADFGAPPGRRALAEAVVHGILAEAALLENDAEEALARVRARCSTLGREIEWTGGDGVAVGLAEDGALVVMKKDGTRLRFRAGEVRIRADR